MELLKIHEQKPVFVAWCNTDLNEGRGTQYPLHVCETPETAHRLGKGQYVQGTDCPVTEVVAVRVRLPGEAPGPWLAPSKINSESREDFRARERREKYESALQRALDAGADPDDIEIIKNHR